MPATGMPLVQLVNKLPLAKNIAFRVNLSNYVLYIPWILRINVFKPTNPKDELV